MKKDITNGAQLKIMTNLGFINTLTCVIRDIFDDMKNNRELVGYYLPQVMELSYMIDVFSQEALDCAESLEVVSSELKEAV